MTPLWTKYWSYWASSIQKYCVYRDYHPKIKLHFAFGVGVGGWGWGCVCVCVCGGGGGGVLLLWISDHMPELQRLQHWSLWMNKIFHYTLYNGCNYLSILGLELIHVNRDLSPIQFQIGIVLVYRCDPSCIGASYEVNLNLIIFVFKFIFPKHGRGELWSRFET